MPYETHREDEGMRWVFSGIVTDDDLLPCNLEFYDEGDAEMDLALVLMLLAVICALTGVGFGIRIANELRARGLQANPLFVRWMIFRYLSVYKRVTLEETGEVGPFYQACSIASSLAAVFAVAGILTKVL